MGSPVNAHVDRHTTLERANKELVHLLLGNYTLPVPLRLVSIVQNTTDNILQIQHFCNSPQNMTFSSLEKHQQVAHSAAHCPSKDKQRTFLNLMRRLFKVLNKLFIARLYLLGHMKVWNTLT